MRGIITCKWGVGSTLFEIGLVVFFYRGQFFAIGNFLLIFDGINKTNNTMGRTPNPDKWKSFAIPAYHALLANGHNWDTHPDMRLAIERIYYDLVWSCKTTNRSGLISVNALKESTNTADHIYSPQFIARMIMDNRDYFFKDMETFMETFYESCKTIIVTPEENMKLRNLTLSVPIREKYKVAGIKLVDKVTGKKVSNLLEVPKKWERLEKKYLLKS